MNNKNDQKRERFKRLATIRTNAVIHRLKVLSNCSNKQIYDYDEKDIEKIFLEIEKKIKDTKSKFIIIKRDEKFQL